MKYKITTAVATEPVSLAEAKLHLRVETAETAEDTLITGLITAAREAAEHYTGRGFAPQTLEVVMDNFPTTSGGIELPLSPVATITSVKYTDNAGVEQTLSSTKYALSLYGLARDLTLTYSSEWPDTQAIPNAVRIVQVCGYATLPKAAKSALLLLIGHLYENRQAVSALKVEEIPMGARALLDTIKIWSF